MAKRKIEKCENFEFLPTEYQEKEGWRLTEKNVLATLCMCHLKYSDFVKDNNGWFYTSIKELSIESGIDDRTVCRIILILRLRELVATKKGTNHRCTWYKLSPKIVELLPKIEDASDAEDVNVTLDAFKGTEEINVTLDGFEEAQSANVTLVKNRLDESSKDESRAISEKNLVETEKDVALVAAPFPRKTEEQLEEEFKAHKERIFKELDERCKGKDYNTIRDIGFEAISGISNLCLEPYYERLKKVITIKTEKLKQQVAFT